MAKEGLKVTAATTSSIAIEPLNQEKDGDEVHFMVCCDSMLGAQAVTMFWSKTELEELRDTIDEALSKN